MSRIGRAPITLPAGVEVKISKENVVSVKGPKGALEAAINPDITVKVDDGAITFTRPTEEPRHRALHGLSRSLVANMVTGVTEGFKKELEVSGVGYRATKDGNKLVMNLGFSHQVIVEETKDVQIDVPAPNKITISGISKQIVGQFAADVRNKRPPEPYKGKGIRYANEVVRRKEGKTGVKK